MENPKNSLAGYSYSPGDASQFECFLGSFEEPPNGETLYHQATQACNPNFWVFLMNCLAVMNNRQATRVM